MDRKSSATNSRFAKAGVSCFYDSEVVNSSFVHLMKFSAKNPRHRKAPKRYNGIVPLFLKGLTFNRSIGAYPKLDTNPYIK